MQVTNIHDAKTHLSKLLRSVEKGNNIVIGRFGKPIARIIPFVEEKNKRKRVLGCAKGKNAHVR